MHVEREACGNGVIDEGEVGDPGPAGNTGAVRCWGDGGIRQLGCGNITSIGDNEDSSSAGNVPVNP